MSSRLLGLAAALLLLSACAAPASDLAEPTGSDTPSATSTPTAPSPDPSPSDPSPSDPSPPDPTPIDPTPTESSGPPGANVIVDDSEFGPMLYSAEGQAIYLFDLEAGPHPHCYDDCADAWPPVLTTGDPVAGRGVRDGLLATVEREDGAMQVTYAGHPLYYYAHEDLWQVLCHDFEDFGGTWFVVQPDGRAAP